MAGDTSKELKVEQERIGGTTLVVPPDLLGKAGGDLVGGVVVY